MAKVEKKLRVHNIIRYEMIFFFLFFYIPLLYRSGFGWKYCTYSLSLTSKQFDAIIDRNSTLLHYWDFVFILNIINELNIWKCKTYNSLLFNTKRAVSKTVTRSCNGWNTYVSRSEHERVTRVTRTCSAFSVEEFSDLFFVIQIYTNTFIQFPSAHCQQSVRSPFIKLPEYAQNRQIKITQLILYIIFNNFTTFVVIIYITQNE